MRIAVENNSRIVFLTLLTVAAFTILGAATFNTIWWTVTAAVLIASAALVALIRRPREQAFYILQWLFRAVVPGAWLILWTAKSDVERHRALIAATIALIGSELMKHWAEKKSRSAT